MDDLGRSTSARRDHNADLLTEECWMVRRSSIGSGVYRLASVMAVLEDDRYGHDSDPGARVKASKALKGKRCKS
jgi:hypothetical protein